MNAKNINHYMLLQYMNNEETLIIAIALIKACITLLPICEYSKHHASISNGMYGSTFFDRWDFVFYI